MSGNIDDILNTFDSEEAFYDPTQDFAGILPEGDYKAHVASVTVKENITVRSKNLADIYNLTFTLSETYAGEKFEVNEKEVDASIFFDKEFRSKGFFRFKKPDPGVYPTLKDNPGANRAYMEMARAVGCSIEENNGVFKLPVINEAEIIGNPVIITVKHDTWTNDNGDEVTTPKVIRLEFWENGKKKGLDTPF